MKIGVISDTHGFFDPALRELLAGVDAILHGGDLDSQSVLDELAEIAPVQAVRGNVDPMELNLPLSRTVRIESVQIQLQHILPISQSELEVWSRVASSPTLQSRRRADLLKSFERETHVVIFGHSHQPCLVTLDDVLFFNPGSAGKRRFALPRCFGVLEILPGGIRGMVRGLEGEKQKLPEEVWLPVKKW